MNEKHRLVKDLDFSKLPHCTEEIILSLASRLNCSGFLLNSSISACRKALSRETKDLQFFSESVVRLLQAKPSLKKVFSEKIKKSNCVKNSDILKQASKCLYETLGSSSTETIDNDNLEFKTSVAVRLFSSADYKNIDKPKGFQVFLVVDYDGWSTIKLNIFHEILSLTDFILLSYISGRLQEVSSCYAKGSYHPMHDDCLGFKDYFFVGYSIPGKEWLYFGKPFIELAPIHEGFDKNCFDEEKAKEGEYAWEKSLTIEVKNFFSEFFMISLDIFET